MIVAQYRVVISDPKDSKSGVKEEWYDGDNLIRVIGHDGSWVYYDKDRNFHREDGPAVKIMEGTHGSFRVEHWLHGVRIPYNKFEQAVKDLNSTPKDTHDAYGLPNDIKKAKEEIKEWRDACEAAFGVVTANPRKTLMAIAEAHRDFNFKDKVIEEFKIIKRQIKDTMEFLELEDDEEDHNEPF